MSAALWALVKARVNTTTTLRQLTNIETPGALTVNDATGTLAADEARAWFRRKSTVTYDPLDEEHTGIAVRATLWVLKDWGGKSSENLSTSKSAIDEDMVAYGQVSARARIVPATTSELEPTDEVPPGQTVRPEFDDERFDGLMPSQPPAP